MFGEQENSNINNYKIILKELLKAQNIIVFILTICVSTLSIEDEVFPFGLAMVAASLSCGIPVFGVLVFAGIGTLIGNGTKAFLNFVLSSIIYFAFILIVKPKVAIEERNEYLKTGRKLFFACFIVSFFQNIKGIILTYDVFMAIVSSALTYVFYKIFVNGLAVIKDWRIKKAFTIEEIIATSIIFAIASMSFNNITIFNLHLSNIIIIFTVMVFGLKSGMLLGATAGLSMGLICSMIEFQSGLQVAVYAVSGIFAGALNRFGKIGVIAGFILGNSLLIYLTNGDTIRIIYLREIFIASLGLLFVPNKMKIEIDDLVGKNKLISDLKENRLSQSEEVSNKLNDLSNTISEMVTDIDGDQIIVDEDFKDILSQNLEEIQDNLFYEEVVNEDNHIVDDIYIFLQSNDILLENDFINILKEHNNFVVVQDGNIKNDLQEIIKIINRSYKMLQIEIVKMQEKNKNLKFIKQDLQNISNIIKNTINPKERLNKFVAKEKEIIYLLRSKYSNIVSCKIKQSRNGKYIISLAFSDTQFKSKQYIINISNVLSKSIGARIGFLKDEMAKNYIQTYSSEDEFSLQIGSSKITKDGNTVSGDCNLQMRLEDGKYLLAISDGMGSGKNARKGSKLAINTLEECLKLGFDDDEMIKIINDKVNFNTDAEMYSTLDFAILDMFLGNAKFVKSGACNTYIKNKQNVSIIKSDSMPVGIIENPGINVQNIQLHDGDIIVMCSDGLLEVKDDVSKDWILEYLKNISTTNVQKIADLIVAEAIDHSYGIARDDITVIIAKVIEKNRNL